MAVILGSRSQSMTFALLGCLAFAGQGSAQVAPAISAGPQGEFVNRVFNDAKGDHKYVVFVPANYTPQKKWPTILFLHGACNRGTDGRSQLVSGLAPAIRLRLTDYPFLVVFPQCENLEGRVLGGWTDRPDDAARALQILDTVENDYSVDKNRECLIGLSMGGAGAWDLAAKNPKRWAAIVPVSAMASTADAPRVARIPTWVFHATHDPMVANVVARNMVEAIKTAGGRAYFSEVTKKAHDLSNVVFTQKALTDWLLDPSREPKQDLDWTEPTGYNDGHELEVPFVAGAEMSRAVRVRMCKDVLEAICYSAPEKMAAKPLSGYVGGVRKSTTVGGFIPVDVTLSGLYYNCQVEQIRIIPKAPNRLILQAGLRNMTMTVSNSQLSGNLLMSASAGPMNVVIGHRAPVWLTVELRPYVQNRRLYLNLSGMNFQIPADNWYVTQPSNVQVRGLPFMTGKVSDGLVDGIYSRKGEIERQVMNSLPAVVQNLENTINETLASKTLAIGQIAMPIWQLRVRAFPEEVLIDDDGITIVSGAQIGALGKRTQGLKLRKFDAPAEFPPPIKTGVEVDVSSNVVPAWSELIIAGNVNCLNVLDFAAKEYQALAGREFLQGIIPDLKKFGDDMEANVDFRLRDPLRLLTPNPSNEPKLLEDAPGNLLTLSMTSVPLRVAVRKKGESVWMPVGELDMSFNREYAPSVKKTGFVRRGYKFAEIGGLRIVPKWEFAPGYNVENAVVDAERLAAAVLKAREAITLMDGVRPEAVPDVLLNGVPLRLETLDWRKSHLISQYQLAGVKVSNDSNEPLIYEVRGPDTAWGQPRTLAPGGFDEYRVPYPLTWRRRVGTETQSYTLPLGKEISFRTIPKPGMVLVNHQEDEQE